MNKKPLIIVAVVIVLIFLGVGGYLMLGKNGNQTSKLPSNAKEESTDSNAITSIQDALSKSMSLECTYSTPEGVSVVAHIKNGMVRSDITGKTAQETSSVIIKDKKMYYWNSQGGFVTEIPDISVTPAAGQDKVTNADSTLTALEQYKNYCKNASVSDSLFVLPTGVKFQDMSSMMKPSGVVVPSGADKAQYEEMMKKYANPTQ